MSTASNTSDSPGTREPFDEASALLKAVNPDIYRLNAFRVTEMPVDATPAEMAKRIHLIKAAANVGLAAQPGRGRALALDHVLDTDSLANAVRSLDDPEQRLIHEFFWFWPHQLGQSRNDEALQALATGDNAKAAAIWQRQENYQSEANVSSHNLAVLSHATALDLEYTAQKRALSEGERTARDQAWAQTYKRWQDLLKQDGFWDRLAERIRAMNDVRLTTGAARRMRSALPQALLSVSAQLAVRAARAQSATDVTRHVTLMKHSGLPQTAIDDVLRQATEPISTQIKTLCTVAEQAAQADEAHANQVARRIIDQTRPLLAELDLILAASDLQRGAMHDLIAETIRRSTILYANKTEDLQTAVPLIDEALKIAVGTPLRKQLEEDKTQLKSTIDDKNAAREVEKLDQVCWFCQQRAPDPNAAVPIKMYGEVTRTPTFTAQGVGVQVNWRNATIPVPRCNYCKDIHNRSSKLTTSFYWGCLLPLVGIPLFLGLMVASAPELGKYWILLLGTAIVAGLIAREFTRTRLKSDRGVKPITAGPDYPIINYATSEGWTVGEKPPGLQSS